MKNLIKNLVVFFVSILSKLYNYKTNNRVATFRYWLYSVWIKRELGKCGTRFIIKSPAILVGGKCISIGDNFTAGNQLRLECLMEFAGENYQPNLTIGNNVLVGNNIHIGCINNISIGNNVLIASNILITDHQHGFIDSRDVSQPPFQRPLQSSGAVVIEDNVWICENASILPGVKIGYGAIIGANAVVTRDVAPNTVVGGIPAKVLKHLDATKYI